METIQKRASPLGNCRAKKANIIGIIHSIIWPCCFCLASAVAGVTIFCCTHIELPTRSGRTRVESGWARFSHRKSLPSGMAVWSSGQE